ncbi:hypothetical protein [Acanthopleuribacter pedis]|uniref:Uncharacterized protein n=1 Tax=Acanthopleuribacter pedis TaxID=442870 RepID=A0A8J7QE34_9BACT|nr:hypothetical protein [Acanthopleuribacter pedis]MBO1317945.1 hypothetical protein [Acanthopleuribacter pedis]
MDSLRHISNSAWYRRFSAETSDDVTFSQTVKVVLRFAFPGGGSSLLTAITLLQGPTEPLHAALAGVAGHEQSTEDCLASVYTAMLHKAYLEAWTRSLVDLDLPNKVVDLAEEPLPALDEFPADFAYQPGPVDPVNDALFALYERYAIRFLRFAELGLMENGLEIILAVIRGNAGHYFAKYLGEIHAATWAQTLKVAN